MAPVLRISKLSRDSPDVTTPSTCQRRPTGSQLEDLLLHERLLHRERRDLSGASEMEKSKGYRMKTNQECFLRFNTVSDRGTVPLPPMPDAPSCTSCLTWMSSPAIKLVCAQARLTDSAYGLRQGGVQGTFPCHKTKRLGFVRLLRFPETSGSPVMYKLNDFSK